MSYAGRLALICVLCHAAGGMRGAQIRAQEANGRRELAPQSAPATGAFEKRDFSAQQAPEIAAPQTAAGVAQGGQRTTEASSTKQFAATHRFWDRENIWLFAGVGAARALDYTSTLNMRRRGRQEILLTNSVVDNHALFAGIEAMGTGASIGVSYWLHRTDHHRLERWASIVHIGVASGGAVRNYSLKTFHTIPAR